LRVDESIEGIDIPSSTAREESMPAIEEEKAWRESYHRSVSTLLVDGGARWHKTANTHVDLVPVDRRSRLVNKGR
jgi:hypothetical protein